MGHQLDGALLKIVGAKEHIESVKAEVKAYLDTKPYDITPYEQTDLPITRDIHVHIQPPRRLSILVGDCITNARAALDYIAQIAGQPFFVPPRTNTLSDRRFISFPISIKPYSTNMALTDAGYVNKLNRFANRGMPADIIEEIKAVQPHNTGYEPLWWLHELVNFDKHCTLLLVAGRLGDMSITFRETTFVKCDYVTASAITGVTAAATQEQKQFPLRPTQWR